MENPVENVKNSRISTTFPRGSLCRLPSLPVEICIISSTGACPSPPPHSLSAENEGESAALIPKGSAAPDYRLALPESVSAPVEEGAKLGTLTVSLGGETLAELPVVAAESVPRLGVGPLFVRLLGSLIGL